MNYVRSFLNGCEKCQLHTVDTTPRDNLKNRIHLNYTTINKLCCAIKNIYIAKTSYKFINVVADEVTIYLVTIPWYRGTSHEIGKALINHVCYKYGLQVI